MAKFETAVNPTKGYAGRFGPAKIEFEGGDLGGGQDPPIFRVQYLFVAVIVDRNGRVCWSVAGSELETRGRWKKAMQDFGLSIVV